MYEKTNLEPIPLEKVSEYKLVANDMGNHICNFNPEQQNEMLRTIRQIVAGRRQMNIEETEKQLSYLKETYQDL
jgi:hypothetical protein